MPLAVESIMRDRAALHITRWSDGALRRVADVTRRRAGRLARSAPPKVEDAEREREREREREFECGCGCERE
jgi:hypothetical protein